MNLRSLRTRVTLLTGLAALVMLAGAAFAMLSFQQRQLFNAVDASLLESVESVEATLADVRFERPGPGTGRGPLDGPNREQLADAARRLVDDVNQSALTLQLLDDSGGIVAASGDLRGVEAVLSRQNATRAQSRLAEGRGFATVDVDGKRRFRVAATNVGPWTLVAGYSLRDVDRSLGAQRAALWLAIPALAALMSLLIWFALGQALRPVETVRRAVMAIGPGELGRRVPEPAGSLEIERLAQTMNDMLVRLDESAERQNRFISDAAHELRSPLAGMRGQLEVNISHPDAPDRAEAEASVLVETKRMQQLVDDLLLLTRADHNSLAGLDHVVDLDDLVLEEAGRLRASTELQIRTEQVSAGQVRGDASQLRRVVRNLADNAARHGRTAVAFTVAETDDQVVLTVSDDGDGVSAADAERIFERFTRLDEARDRDSGGSGLGLAISREIAHKHGGTLTLDASTVPSTGTLFVLTLPRPTDAV